MIVIDTSAALKMLLGDPTNQDLVQRILSDGDLHAPHLIDLEVLHALRRLNIRRRLSDEQAMTLRAAFTDLAVVRYPHHPLADRIWELRHNLSAYDAAFVGLAEALGAPLVTCDSRIADASGHQANVEVYA